MIALALRSLRHRPGGMIGTFVAIFFGAAVVLAFGALMETGLRADVGAERLAATSAVLAGPQSFQVVTDTDTDDDGGVEVDTESAPLAERVRIDDSYREQVAAVPGVRAAIGDLSFPAAPVINGEPVVAHGHTASSLDLAPYPMAVGDRPGPGQIAVDQHLATTAGIHRGDDLTVMIDGQQQRFSVSGVVDTSGPIVGTPGANAVFFDDAQAVGLAGHPGGWDAIGILADPAAAADPIALRAALQGAVDSNGDRDIQVLIGDERGLAEFDGAAAGSGELVLIGAVSGGLSVTVAIFVIMATLGLAIHQRKSELALLRAVGTTPRQLRRMLNVEAVVVGAIAGVLAVFPGRWLASWMLDRLIERGAAPEALTFHQGWIPMVAAIGVAVLAALAASWMVGRRAATVRPAAALAEAAVEGRWLTRTRATVAALCFAGGIALIIVTLTVFDGPIAASTAGPAVMLWACGLAMVSPGLVRWATWFLQWPIRMFGSASGDLATVNNRTRPVRTAAAVTPIMLTTGLALGMIYLQTTTSAVQEQHFADSLRADAVVASATGPLASGTVDAVARLPETGSVSGLLQSEVYVGENALGEAEGVLAQGITPGAAEAVVGEGVVAGSLDDLVPGTVVLSSGLAADAGVGVGDPVPVRFGDNARVESTVVAITEQDTGFDPIVRFGIDELAAHTTVGRPDRLLIRAADGIGEQELLGAVAGVLDQPGVRVGGRDQLVSMHAETGDAGTWINIMLVAVMILYTAIALVNAQVMSAGRRSREFGLLRLSGAQRGQVLRMTAVEAGLIAAIGIGLGVLLSATTLVPFSLLVSGSVLPTGPISVLLVTVGAGALLTLLATVLPTWRATAKRPAEAVLAGN